MPPSPNVKASAVEIGILISTFLYGIATVQTYTYFRGSAKDPLWIKTMVAVVWLLETFVTILTWMYLYKITITDFGDFDALQEMPWTLDLSFFIGGLISALVQSFFAYRVRIISGNWTMSVISWTLSTARVGITLTICILAIQENRISSFEARYPWAIILSLVIAMIIDWLNTCSLCYYLHKLRTQFEVTNSIIDRIMMYSIETGLLTSICAVLMLILDLSRPDWNIWISILLFYVKLYSNSLLLSLNGRSSLRGKVNISTMTAEHFDPQRSTVINVSRTREVVIEMESMKRSDESGGRSIDDRNRSGSKKRALSP